MTVCENCGHGEQDCICSEFDPLEDFSICTFCKVPYGSPECYNCPEYTGPLDDEKFC